VFAPGLLAGTTAPNSGRLSVGTKSPLTGGIKEANSGGQAAQRLGRLRVAAVIVQGSPGDKRYVLHLSKEGARLDDGAPYWGQTNYECAAALRAAYGEKVATIQVGPAGEMGYRNSTVAVTDPEGNPARHAGRGGVGAVMGARGLKAIVVDDAGTERPSIVDKDRFDVARKTLVDGLKSHPVTGQGLPNYGTAILINIINEAGGLPTRNFSLGRFDRAEAISGETVHQNCEDRGGRREHACMTGCVVHCSNVYNDKNGAYVSSGVEYESIWALGANCDNDDIDAIARMDRLCDELGLDTIEMGDTFAVAMEGGAIPWGDAGRMIELFEEVRQGTALGRQLGNGVVHAGREFGVSRVPAVKGQGIPAYDPRAVKGIGVTYATSTMGADHTSGYAVATNILKVGGDVDPLVAEGQCALSNGLQQATVLFDSAGFCVFLAFAALDQPDSLAAMPEMISAMYGVDFTVNDIGPYGETLLALERDYNRAAGFTAEDDRLPKFFSEERLPPHDVIWDVKDEDLNQVCGWSPVMEF
ncbi:MAG TPA: aldehyde ferredoxin oxidoreductase C-terminal domain-containing protein, partial [Thermoleophilia bacterium]|nr:aldehyde ferredoxin oxidoreductase C-terminal domain-containing protein [Thermoleophilia bacterium]